MLEGKCHKCGYHCYGWALLEPENQTCEQCGSKLVITRVRDRVMPMAMDGILLIHPNPKTITELTSALEHGFQVVTAVDGQQALAEIPRTKPEVIVIAEALAKMNGDELCMRIREICEAPIIILGEHRKERAGIHFLESGADAYVASPLNVRLLLARVHSLLRRSKQRE